MTETYFCENFSFASGHLVILLGNHKNLETQKATFPFNMYVPQLAEILFINFSLLHYIRRYTGVS